MSIREGEGGHSPGSAPNGGRWWWCSTTAVAANEVGWGGSGGGGKRTADGLRLNRGSRFGHARAALSDGHTPTLYYQTKRKVRAPP